MAIIFYKDPELVIALKNHVIFVNPYDMQIFKILDISADIHKLNCQGDDNNYKLQKELAFIQHLELSPDRQFLAVATSGVKALLIYKCYAVCCKFLSIRALERSPSSITFSKNCERLLIADKTGNCFECNCLNVGLGPRHLFGHMSIVYKVLWNAGEQLIITCDRDDKVRLTNYPNTFDIYNYCMGHKEFVADILLIPNEHNLLISVSGDATLKLWNIMSTQMLAQYQLPSPGYKLAIRSLNNSTYNIAVLLYPQNQGVAVYNLVKKETSEGESVWEMSENKRLVYSDFEATDLCFVGSNIYVAGFLDKHFKLWVSSVEYESTDVTSSWLQMVENEFKNLGDCKLDDISTWFKKHYDNVSVYLEGKRRRIKSTRSNSSSFA